MAVPADIGLGDQRKAETGIGARIVGAFDIGGETGGAGVAFDHDEIGYPFSFRQRDVEEIRTLRFAPHAARENRRIRRRRQRQRAMADAEPDPIEHQRQIEQRRRNALGRRHLAVGARQRRHAITGLGQDRIGGAVHRGRLRECEHALAREAGAGNGQKQHRPRPEADIIVERVTEHDDEIEHQRQIERRDGQAGGGKAPQRNARPAAGDESHEDDARHHAAQRDQSEHIVFELIAEAADAVVDGIARQPRHMAGGSADSVEREVAGNDAAIEAQGHQRGRHQFVHDDVAAEDDREILMRERQHQQ